MIVFAILLGSEYCNVEDADNLFRISLHTTRCTTATSLMDHIESL